MNTTAWLFAVAAAASVGFALGAVWMARRHAGEIAGERDEFERIQSVLTHRKAELLRMRETDPRLGYHTVTCFSGCNTQTLRATRC
ncbi:MAG: hypothetical protein Q7R45_08385 [Sulfuricaulis sp.]|nr:hypothetical protein [Sulfuricaulis sp.]